MDRAETLIIEQRSPQSPDTKGVVDRISPQRLSLPPVANASPGSHLPKAFPVSVRPQPGTQHQSQPPAFDGAFALVDIGPLPFSSAQLPEVTAHQAQLAKESFMQWAEFAQNWGTWGGDEWEKKIGQKLLVRIYGAAAWLASPITPLKERLLKRQQSSRHWLKFDGSDRQEAQLILTCAHALKHMGWSFSLDQSVEGDWLLRDLQAPPGQRAHKHLRQIQDGFFPQALIAENTTYGAMYFQGSNFLSVGLEDIAAILFGSDYTTQVIHEQRHAVFDQWVEKGLCSPYIGFLSKGGSFIDNHSFHELDAHSRELRDAFWTMREGILTGRTPYEIASHGFQIAQSILKALPQLLAALEQGTMVVEGNEVVLQTEQAEARFPSNNLVELVGDNALTNALRHQLEWLRTITQKHQDQFLFAAHVDNFIFQLDDPSQRLPALSAARKICARFVVSKSEESVYSLEQAQDDFAALLNA